MFLNSGRVGVHERVEHVGRADREELLLVDAELLSDAGFYCAGQGEGDVEVAGLYLACNRRRGVTDLDDNLVEVMRPRAAVVAVRLQDDAVAADELGDVVGAGARERRRDALRCDRQVGRNRAEVRHRHPRREVRDPLRQPDYQLVAGGPDAGDVLEVPGSG